MQLAIFGAGGHGGVVADSAEALGWAVRFFDDGRSGRCADWEIAGGGEQLLAQAHIFDGVIVAIGANGVRLDWLGRLRWSGAKIVTIIDRAATVSKRASVGDGCYLGAGSVVNQATVIETACIINTGATVDHDCYIAEGCHLSPGVHVSGSVRIGRSSWIGTGTSVRNNIMIGDNVIAGVGSAIVSNIESGLTVVGVPARPLERR